MVSHPFVYQLVLFALIWLFIMLHLTRPTPGVSTPVTPAEPNLLKPKRHRSSEPKPFEGLTHKPHCALCDQDTASPKAPPPVPPAPMAPTHRRPRVVDTSRHFCPHSDCDYRGWLGLGNLRANGHPSGGPWRQFHCTSCQGYFLETHGTLFHGKQAAVELIVRQSGKDLFVSAVCLDMARHLDLFLRAVLGDADGRGDLHREHGAESCVLCKGVSRHAVAMSVPMPV